MLVHQRVLLTTPGENGGASAKTPGQLHQPFVDAVWPGRDVRLNVASYNQYDVSIS